MTKYHINPETGNPGICKARQQCRFGPASDHYASPEEAREAFERSMSKPTKKTIIRPQPTPIVLPPTALAFREYPDSFLSHAADYDYDSYDCSDPNCGDDGDMCRDRVYEGLRLAGFNYDNMETFARSYYQLPAKEPLDPQLLAKLEYYNTHSTLEEAFEVEAENGYYGEEAFVIPTPEFKKILEDYYYAQPNAMGPENILAYLRGKGFATEGLRPLDAIKESLKQENGGRSVKAVESAKQWKTASISLKSIVKASKSQANAAAANPANLIPVKEAGMNAPIAGVVVQEGDKYRLVDGYHRTASLEGDNRRKGTYIVLTADAPKRWGPDLGWYQE